MKNQRNWVINQCIQTSVILILAAPELSVDNFELKNRRFCEELFSPFYSKIKVFEENHEKILHKINLMLKRISEEDFRISKINLNNSRVEELLKKISSLVIWIGKI